MTIRPSTRIILDIGIVLMLLGLVTLFYLPSRAVDGGEVWSEPPTGQLDRALQDRILRPHTFRTARADTDLLRSLLNTAPQEIIGQEVASETILSLPFPDGSMHRFQILESPIMEPELAAAFPHIKTYVGRGVDDPGMTARLDWTAHGFHAMIRSPQGMIYIDPISNQSTDTYMSYFKGDYPTRAAAEQMISLEAEPRLIETELSGRRVSTQIANVASGDQLKIYRLAVAATGEYTAFHGGSVSDAQSAIVTTINRVNMVYERDIAVRFTLIGNNDSLIFTDPGSDPYSQSVIDMLDQNQATLDSIIGNGNYDIGHVFGLTQEGGVAASPSVCEAGFKAQGVSTLSSPDGEVFYIDMVSHEIGHQLGAFHTFNSLTDGCNGNRSGSTAYEPGSGSSIMSYAGICGADDVSNFSDDFFHTASIDQMRAEIDSGSGSQCGTIINTANNAPSANAGNDYTIPINTPFELTGSANDSNGDTLTYNWEQFDLGPGGSPSTTSTTAPLFKAIEPSNTPIRTFLGGSTIGEQLPAVGRILTFRFVTRDNNAASGGLDYDTAIITVEGSAGPFRLTAPTSAVSWTGGTSETITWDVANTAAAPINCSQVNILLSLDSGTTYPFTLIRETANDGSETITVPNLTDSEARLKIACSDNIFFDVSNVDFSITGIGAQALTDVVIDGPSTGIAGAEYTFTATASPGTADQPMTYTWTATEQTGPVQTNLSIDTATFRWFENGTKSITVTASNSQGPVSSTTFMFEVDGSSLFLPLIQTR